MSAALLIRERNPDANFVLHGGPPHYTPFARITPVYHTERTCFYPTNSDITTTTKDLSQHRYRADLYRDILQDDSNVRSSLRSAARSLRLVSNDIRKNLEEESTAKSYLASRHGTLRYRDQLGLEEAREEPAVVHRTQTTRPWLTDSEWNTSSGHYVAFDENIPRTMLLNREPSTTSGELVRRSLDQEREATRLWRTVNVDMNMAEVPLTRFTRKDLMASEYFPVTMSSSGSEGSRSARRSRSRSSSRHRLVKSAVQERSPVTDNFQNMKRLEKLYLVTSEAPATDYSTANSVSNFSEVEYRPTVMENLCATVDLLLQAVICSPSVPSAPHAVVSPYLDEIAKLRMERLRLEEEHLKELNRLTTLERVRGPKPKWYELKDTQFHFEAGKNNELLRTQQRWNSALESASFELSRSQPDLSTLRMRSASFS